METKSSSTTNTNRCECGKRIRRYAKSCNACHERRMEAVYADAERIVATGRCPDCGHALKRNSSLHGWWQCEQYGADSFRRYADRPSCSFQVFTR